jgi:hypothetical protein
MSHDNLHIHIGIDPRVSVGMGAKKDHLLRLELARHFPDVGLNFGEWNHAIDWASATAISKCETAVSGAFPPHFKTTGIG